MESWLSSIKHIFKLDPNKPISDAQIEQLATSGTDAIVIGGTLDITYEDTRRLLKEVRKHSILVIQEISDMEAIVPGFDYYYIPLVLNAQNPDWIFNIHQYALKEYGDLVNWNQVIVEGYVVLNPESAVAKLTDSKTDLEMDDLVAYARLSDQLLKLPILYIEYSGTYGDVEWIKEVRSVVHHSRIFYGGGINSLEKAKEMAKYADTIIVGNLIYENFEQALSTVQLLQNKSTIEG